MRNAAALLLLLSLAACSKPEPDAAAPEPTPPPSPTVGAELARSTPAPAAPPAPDRASSAPTSDPAAEAPRLQPGEALFTATCATCHMPDGGGVPNMQPSIIGSAWISNPDPQPLLSLILRGSAILGDAAQAYSNDMAPQDHLTDAEVAAVASYVRLQFAATSITAAVTPAQVARARQRPGLAE